MPALTTGPGVIFPCSCSAWKAGSKYPTSSALNILLYGLQDDVGGGGAGGGADGAGGGADGAAGGAGGEVSMEGRTGEEVCCRSNRSCLRRRTSAISSVTALVRLAMLALVCAMVVSISTLMVLRADSCSGEKARIATFGVVLDNGPRALKSWRRVLRACGPLFKTISKVAADLVRRW